MKIRGFTLIELLITIAVVGILLVSGVPTMRHLILVNRATSQVDHIVAALQYARSEAIKLNVNVKYCGSSDHKTCDGAWSHGQIALAGNEVLRVFGALAHSDALTWDSSLNKDEYLEFSPLGTTNGQSGSFYYRQNQKDVAKIVVNNAGRIRVEKSL